MRSEELDVTDLTLIPLAIAMWCRYLLGVDDRGEPFALSPDPLMDELQRRLQGVTLGDTTSNVRAIIGDEGIFGVQLYEVGLGDKIESMFHELIAKPGAVRETLNKYVG
ncbi:hypothetical protein D3C77_541860 [compost metagenome]